MINGIVIGIIELSFYFFISHIIKKKWYNNLSNINVISYYWLTMTILTGIWEAAFVYNYDNVSELSKTYLQNHKHVWTTDYNLSYILPWKLSSIFYAEYGAYADREYMVLTNHWSRIIESTHALFCGLFALFAIINKVKGNERNYLITMSVAMGTQLMNSILYMGNYFIETENKDNVNFNNSSFPCGFALLGRPFMYVNIFWTLMPCYAIIVSLCSKGKKKSKQICI